MKKLTALRQLFVAMLFVPCLFSNAQAQDGDSEQGNMTYIISENVSPSNFSEYEQWIKEFKTIADATGAPNYGVGQHIDGMNFFMSAGKTWADFGEMEKKFGEWFVKNPKLKDLDNKYGHTVNFTVQSLWRQNPSQTYVPEGYDDSKERPYTRVNKNWINYGQTEKANEIIAEYKAAWKAAGISESTRAYWNVFGEENNCVAFVTSYASREAWIASRQEIMNKVGEAKLKELDNKWNSILRKEEISEMTDRPDLAHWVE